MLTVREQILEFYVRGLNGSQIAEQLQLSPHTVRQHTASIRASLDSRTIAEAVWQAHLLGFLSHGEMAATG